ncbi:MAG: alanine--tRNA ligase [Planctomycetota bacterium]|nr:MAG: alanine--tRNA ligase [Planctomycetota bacterium]
MKTDEIREKFLTFFEGKGCVRRPSDVLVPKDDPTVLFTPAGMNQFKNQFLGIGKLEFTRAVTCQKCLRTGDIENVGVTAYHHTFFEMLGNFSFGDYFKREAILWAWEFLTSPDWLGLPPERLSVSVYRDEKDDRNSDHEAFRIWHEEVGLPEDRIAWRDEYENFWPAGAPTEGPDGVCGPCSEIFYHPPGTDEEVEVWNLVFTQFNRVGPPPNNLRPLPKKNIDTGMGLERIASVMQSVPSNFEIDILRPLCERAGEVVGVPYRFEGPQGRPLRRIADHIRAATFAIHEGVNPSNEKAGYVIRQLLRRALLEGYLLGREEPFLHKLVPTVVELMRRPYPELVETQQSVADVIREEEEQFLHIVERGVRKFRKLAEKARQSGGVISGEDAFDLHQSEGFLIELTEALAARENLKVDRKQFDICMAELRERSGRGAFADSVMAEGPLDSIRKEAGDTEFLGYQTTRARGRIVGLIVDRQRANEFSDLKHVDPIAVILDRTPFYGEAGGQVGDTGTLRWDGGEFLVRDTQRHAGLILHIGRLKQGTLRVGQTVEAIVDEQRRAGIRRAHSATHLLHYALRKTLGENATQRGSKVDNDELRFDFAHRGPLTPEELRRIEDEINARIAEGVPVRTREMPLEEARRLGAMALFGEKYPDIVRVVQMGDFSIELCGGTHLENTGQVGVCRIESEEPVAKGVRRITAVTGRRALQRLRHTEELLRQIATALKTPNFEELPRRVAALQEEVKQLRQQLAQKSRQTVAEAVEEVLKTAEHVGDVTLVGHVLPEASRESLREFVDQVRKRAGQAAVIVGTVIDGKPALTAALSKPLLQQGLNAAECVRTAAKKIQGGGGGRPDLAEAGGKNPDGIQDAIAAGLAYFRDKLAAATPSSS